MPEQKKPEPQGMNVEQFMYRMAGKVDVVFEAVQAMKKNYEKAIVTLFNEFRQQEQELAEANKKLKELETQLNLKKEAKNAVEGIIPGNSPDRS